jgi:hypothetical protein
MILCHPDGLSELPRRPRFGESLVPQREQPVERGIGPADRRLSFRQPEKQILKTQCRTVLIDLVVKLGNFCQPIGEMPPLRAGRQVDRQRSTRAAHAKRLEMDAPVVTGLGHIASAHRRLKW